MDGKYNVQMNRIVNVECLTNRSIGDNVVYFVLEYLYSEITHLRTVILS